MIFIYHGPNREELWCQRPSTEILVGGRWTLFVGKEARELAKEDVEVDGTMLAFVRDADGNRVEFKRQFCTTFGWKGGQAPRSDESRRVNNWAFENARDPNNGKTDKEMVEAGEYRTADMGRWV